MSKTINVKPISVNTVWCGRRFKTPAYKQYEKDCLTFLKGPKLSGWVEIEYKFYIKNFKMTDVGNFEKPITDLIVKAGLIDDDRFVKKITAEKFADKDERIEVIITKYENT